MARVLGKLTMSKTIANVRAGSYLIAEAFDGAALAGVEADTATDTLVPRATPMAESLVVFDQLGAGPGQLIAVSEGSEATMPFYPDRVCYDAYCTAILDSIDIQ